MCRPLKETPGGLPSGRQDVRPVRARAPSVDLETVSELPAPLEVQDAQDNRKNRGRKDDPGEQGRKIPLGHPRKDRHHTQKVDKADQDDGVVQPDPQGIGEAG